MNIRTHMSLLGCKCKDKVTGMVGVVTCLSFDLYGCIQVILSPVAKKGERPAGGMWMDVARMSVMSAEPVMPLPDYDMGYVAEGRKGPAFKPAGRC